ncbi:hypothetical protein PMIN01_02688 [Paraphaeosphaeria minitans]|uniref:Uncharacterized protein n=1 Tax=Paraphaeosphaeria minitans TaxID=565426 RepID=A0A9P6GRS9_9PLEO|nr:hypothetical protein PMIN01_02688 [Paraphaeosphaeria minitans]
MSQPQRSLQPRIMACDESSLFLSPPPPGGSGGGCLSSPSLCAGLRVGSSLSCAPRVADRHTGQFPTKTRPWTDPAKIQNAFDEDDGAKCIVELLQRAAIGRAADASLTSSAHPRRRACIGGRRCLARTTYLPALCPRRISSPRRHRQFAARQSHPPSQVLPD